MNELTLRIVTPSGVAASVDCDSVTLIARDDADGNGGGSVGIRRGHIPAVIALENGSAVKTSSDGAQLRSFTVSGAFARVRDNVVTVVAEDVIE